MNTQHKTSFAKAILGSTQRLFKFKKKNSVLASNHINARTMRDIGIDHTDLL